MPVQPFASVADMEARFDRAELVQLTNQSNSDSIDQPRLVTEIMRASTEIVSAIAAKYDVAAGLGDMALARLKDLCCDLARYYLYRETAPEGVKERYKAARTDLADLAAGRTKLDAGSQTIAARPEGVLVQVPDRIFGREAMGGF